MNKHIKKWIIYVWNIYFYVNMPVYSWKLTKLVHLPPFFFRENNQNLHDLFLLTDSFTSLSEAAKKSFIEINFIFPNMNHFTKFKVVSKLIESIDMISTYEPGSLKWSF